MDLRLWRWRLTPGQEAFVPANVDLNTITAWQSTARFPTQIHIELLAVKAIDDPFTHEEDVQWVSDCSWQFACTYIATADDLRKRKTVVFDGLDTFATIAWNGQQVLETENAFRTFRLPIREHVRLGENELLITFDSTFRRGKALEAQYGKRVAWNGDPSRVYVRTPQYTYGWDWGPKLISCGPWRDVRLIETPIAEMRTEPSVSADLKPGLKVHVKMLMDTERLAAIGGTISVSLAADPAAPAIARVEPIRVTTCKLEYTLIFSPDDLKQISLWYPAGEGGQTMYSVILNIGGEGYASFKQDAWIGFRRVDLVEEESFDYEGTSFYFQVNNKPIFLRGSNWIPADSFQARVSPTTYYEWLSLVSDGNQNCLRVWGGGVYESDDFYEACDRAGILVWQDFAFACGIYPAHLAFRKNVQAEVVDVLRRLAYHPSIIVWAGNNEDYAVAESSGAYDAKLVDGPFANTGFPARQIYERDIPRLFAEHHPLGIYRYGCPFGGAVSSDPTRGDIHQWNVWHGDQRPYQDWPVLAGRFVSEFGMQALPDTSTLQCFLKGHPSDQHPQSQRMQDHNKAAGATRRLAGYLAENFRFTNDLEGMSYATQVMQADCLKLAFKSWLRLWKSDGNRQVGGALVWQLNDCWPCTSWSICVTEAQPKMAYYAMKQALTSVSCGIARRADQQATVYDAWAVNLTSHPVQIEWTISFFGFDSSKPILSFDGEHELGANGCTELSTIGRAVAHLVSRDTIAHLQIRFDSFAGMDGKSIFTHADDVDWPQPCSQHPIMTELPRVWACIDEPTAGCFSLHADRPVKAVWLGCDSSRPIGMLERNGLDIMPGQGTEVGCCYATLFPGLTARFYGCDTPFELELRPGHVRRGAILTYSTSVDMSNIFNKSKKLRASTGQSKIPHHDTNKGRHSDVLIDRYEEFKHIAKSLSSYYGSIAATEEATSKSLTKHAGDMQLPLQEGDQFLSDNTGFQYALYEMRDNTKSLAEAHAEFASAIHENVVGQLETVRADLKAHIHSISSDTGSLADDVDHHREASTKAIGNHSRALGMTGEGLSAVGAKEDPYITHGAAEKQLLAQLHKENSLTASVIKHQKDSEGIELKAVQGIKSAAKAFSEAQEIFLEKLKAKSTVITQALTAVDDTAEWKFFVSEESRLVPHDTPKRDPKALAFPGQNDPRTKPLRTGILERKKRFTKSYEERVFLLTPTGYLHEAKNMDLDAPVIEPVLSIYLPNAILGPPADKSAKKHKFYIEGYKAGDHKAESKGLRFGKKDSAPAFTFKARSHEEMMSWWESIKELTKESIAVAPRDETKYKATSLPDAVANVGLPSAAAEVDDEESSADELEDAEEEVGATTTSAEKAPEESSTAAAPVASTSKAEEENLPGYQSNGVVAPAEKRDLPVAIDSSNIAGGSASQTFASTHMQPTSDVTTSDA
ncbi:glycoside hydrolase family 2 protein [Mixia osmundae IAM 14324]|uniref:beta-mannosidase n=1 Tax=Mixia osmundae (strain CBS 9802 / IAM 14324 / JCM 22182 / KY 12970) TaxID=764103 RepID=G7E4Y1_MIXOS|nr:glycoside hydrolase family 2 protein [Mixia osmundae IAM 14324]KEI37753.1 glycoside hydrolase family 2 protein [Mixia osmundae IAM 14324]GAA97891.1 hypothetical protein E5Q_04571 [Mixia osmundae IAM 14324]